MIEVRRVTGQTNDKISRSNLTATLQAFSSDNKPCLTHAFLQDEFLLNFNVALQTIGDPLANNDLFHRFIIVFEAMLKGFRHKIWHSELRGILFD